MLLQVYDRAFYGMKQFVSTSGRRDLAVIDLSALAVHASPGIAVTWTLTPLSLVSGRAGGGRPDPLCRRMLLKLPSSCCLLDKS